MDRFIEIEVVASTIKSRYLKSNMDRFIGVKNRTYLKRMDKFKIQYG
mgnify:FL=1